MTQSHAHDNTFDPACWQSPWLIPGTDVRVHLLSIPDMAAGVLSLGDYGSISAEKNRFFEPSDTLLNFLSPEEIASVNRFKTLKKQIEWMAGRYLLKIMAARYLAPGHLLSSIAIGIHPQGSPYLAGFPGTDISLSHAGGMAAAALCTRRSLSIGIDVEPIPTRLSHPFMITAFSERERRHLKMDPQTTIVNWTRKEAFLKYIKQGFNESLHKVEVLGDTIWYHGIPNHVQVRTRIIGGDYALSVVWGRPVDQGC